MSTFTYGYDKQYKCSACNEFYEDIEILAANSWKCPECGEYIRIAAPDLNTGHTLIRKSVTELKPNDLVHMLGAEDTYAVITTEKSGKNQVSVALKGFGKKRFNTTDFVNVVDGGYYEEHWKNNSFETTSE